MSEQVPILLIISYFATTFFKGHQNSDVITETIEMLTNLDTHLNLLKFKTTLLLSSDEVIAYQHPQCELIVQDKYPLR